MTVHEFHTMPEIMLKDRFNHTQAQPSLSRPIVLLVAAIMHNGISVLPAMLARRAQQALQVVAVALPAQLVLRA
jgi:hypothetical protein